MSNKPTHDGGTDTKPADEDEPTIPLTRRSVVLTMVAGGASASEITGTVEAAGSGDVEASVNDAYGGNAEGKPNRLEIAEGSQFKITTPDSIASGSIIMVELYVRPAGGSYEQLGRAAFQESSSRDTYIIAGSDYSDSARNLFNHSGISLSSFEVRKDLSHLENPDNRYVQKDIDVKIEAKPRGGSTFAQAEQTFTVSYALKGGLGVNLGYSLGQTWPTDSPDFESQVEGN